MNAGVWLRIFLQYMLLLPAMMFCALPLEKRFRYPAGRIYAAAAVLVALVSAAMAMLNSAGYWIDTSTSSVVIAALGCAICLKVTNAGLFQLINIFVNAIALLSFTGIACVMVEIRLYPNGVYQDTTVYGLIVQWALMLILLAAMWQPLRKQYAWLVSDYHEESVWRVSWLVPALIAACIMVMVPRCYINMWVGRAYEVTLFIISVLWCLLIFFNVVFYRMARSSVERAQLIQRAEILEIQASQHARLQERMERTAQQRHDFRHSIRVLNKLAQNGELDELRRYTAEYDAKLEDAAPMIYCSNAAVNAVLGYYASIAEQNGVQVRLQINLPDPLPVAELDLCGVLGNLMENAIDACRMLPVQQRYLAVSTDMQGGRLYIVSTNSFDGTLKMRNGDYLSTKRHGKGMGLKSIRAVAERYRGAMNARADGAEFCVDVYLRGD